MPRIGGEGEALKYAVAILVGVFSLSIGIYGWRGTRSMLRNGEAHLLLDWRRLFADRADTFSRGEQAGSFWIAIVFNVLLTTICIGFALGVLFLVFGSVAALWFGRTRIVQ